MALAAPSEPASQRMLVPVANAPEAALVDGLEVIAVPELSRAARSAARRVAP